MKRVITLLLLLVAVAATINARTYVLITGVSNYNHPKIQNLPQATKDAKTVYNLMKARYPDTSILTGSNANCGNVLEKLGRDCEPCREKRLYNILLLRPWLK